MNIKSKLKKSSSLLVLALALTTFNACTDMRLYSDQVNKEDSELSNIPLDFDWSVSKDVNIELKSDVTTRVFIYEDEDLSKLMCTKVLEADKTENISLSTLATLDKLYLAYIDNNGKTALRTIDLTQNKLLTRSADISGEITDAAEVLPSIDGNKTMVFSPNRTIFGTVLFEDMYPHMGDYDMNDFVLGYRKQYGSDDTKETLEITLQVRAIGGNLPFIPGVEILGVDVADIDVSWTTSDARLSLDNASENDESGTPVFRVNGAQSLKKNGQFFNVNLPKEEPDNLPYITITLTRNIDDKKVLDIKDKDLNFFIYNTNTKVEIHEKNANVTRFSSNYDDKKFHNNGLVWAFRVEGYMPHAIEGIKIVDIFPKISSWMKSSGKKDADWITEYNRDLVIDYSEDTSSDDTQEPYINIKQSVVEAEAAGGKVEVPIEANCDFDVSLGEKGWIYDFNKKDGKLILYVYNNYNGTDKSATITLSPTTDINKKFTFTLNQKSEAYSGTQINTNNYFRNNIINLVQANGGVVEDVKVVNIIGHSDKYKGYAKADLPANVWDITDGKFTDRVYMEWNASNGTITVSTPGAIVRSKGTCYAMFQNLTGLEKVDLTGLDISRSTQMGQMFDNCNNLRAVDLTPLNTENVTTMFSMFSRCEKLETVKLTGLNTANVANFEKMFDRCYSLKSVDISTWNTQSVTNMFRMFWNCNSLEEVKLKCSKTSLTSEKVKEMFVNCYALKRIDMSSFDFHDAEYLNSTFSGCTSLQEVIFGENNTSKIKEIKNAFLNVGGNGEFTCVNADFSSVTSMENAFKGATATSFNLSGWKTENVQSFQSLFQNCKQAKTINLSGWSANSAVKLSHMFNTTNVIEEIDLGRNFNIPVGIDKNYWFYCTANTSKSTVLKCPRITYDELNKYIQAGGGNSKTFLTKYCTFSVYE